MSDENLNLDTEIAKAEKEIDVLMLTRKWSRELGKLNEADKKMVLGYLNTKHGG